MAPDSVEVFLFNTTRAPGVMSPGRRFFGRRPPTGHPLPTAQEEGERVFFSRCESCAGFVAPRCFALELPSTLCNSSAPHPHPARLVVSDLLGLVFVWGTRRPYG